MKLLSYNSLAEKEKQLLMERPAINLESTLKIVKPIIDDIKNNGLTSVLKYAKKFDGFTEDKIIVTKAEIDDSENQVDDDFKIALKEAYLNIKKFHEKQLPAGYSIETTPGIKCSREFRAIENVGLYIPGGTAVLPSTLLMLAVPAIIAGCRRIIVCNPARNNKIHPAVLYASKMLGINEIYKVGGAQAIALMAYGTEKISKVNKIFGPGNQYVTAAKALVSIDPKGSAIDMLAGPSELMIIADEKASPDFISADLLSQAEHGEDSQVILCTTSIELGEKVIKEIEKQIQNLDRMSLARKALNNSFILVFPGINEAVEFSNNYAPEHLILNLENASKWAKQIKNAGSVFIGKYSPESVGDYASGTNHSLPTYGSAKYIGGVSVEMFIKSITFQELSAEGLTAISKTVIKLAETESLQAHANSIKIRLTNGN